MGKIMIDSSLNRKYLSQLFELDLANFGIAEGDNWKKIAESKPELYSVLRRNDKVLGYTLVLPLRNQAYGELKQGRLSEEELNLKDITENPGGFYVASVASDPNAKKFPFIGGTLVGMVAGQTMRLPMEVLTIAISRTGENLANMWNMNEIGNYDLLTGVNGFQPKIFVKGGLN